MHNSFISVKRLVGKDSIEKNHWKTAGLLGVARNPAAREGKDPVSANMQEQPQMQRRLFLLSAEGASMPW